MTQRTITGGTTTITFDTWRGQFQAPRKPVTTFIRSGVPGVGAITGAAQPQRIEVSAQLVDDLATCQTTAADLLALIGTFIEAEDDLGNSYDHTLLEACTTSITPATGDGDAVLTAALVLWPASTTP